MRHLRTFAPLILTLCAVLASGTLPSAQITVSWLDPYREHAARLIKAAMADDFAWQRLAELTDTYGNRLSGSDNLKRAIDWALDTLRKDGFENVRAERVTVPHWVRGVERAEMIDPPLHELTVLGLGGTVATPPAGLEGDVLVVKSFEELRSRGAEAKGRIVVFDAPFTNYSDTVSFRTGGARAAAQHGAIAVLVRAVGPIGLRTPHTGSVNYSQDTPAIPAAALAAEDVSRIVRITERGRRVRLRLHLDSQVLEDAESANVVAELRGREKPEEIVLLGGHLDSWDVGTGASDDAVGCIVTWEAVRLIKSLGIRPRRTIRVVLWTNEENGIRGATAYADKHRAHASNHVFALESDTGVFEPARLGFSGSSIARTMVRDIASLLSPIGMSAIGPGGGGADIGPIAQAGDVPTMAYQGDPARYFVIHHTPADTVERIAPSEVSKATAAIAVMIYVIAEMPERLPR
jgi:carboxypeptidase Q